MNNTELVQSYRQQINNTVNQFNLQLFWNMYNRCTNIVSDCQMWLQLTQRLQVSTLLFCFFQSEGPRDESQWDSAQCQDSEVSVINSLCIFYLFIFQAHAWCCTKTENNTIFSLLLSTAKTLHIISRFHNCTQGRVGGCWLCRGLKQGDLRTSASRSIDLLNKTNWSGLKGMLGMSWFKVWMFL